MAYTLATVRQRVLNDKLDDTSYDASVVDGFINDTQRSIFHTYELPFMEKTFSGLLASGENVFAFPADYQQAQFMVISNPEGKRRDLTDAYQSFRTFVRSFPTPENNTPSTPSVWTLHGNNLILNCPTDQSYTLKLYYIKTPTLLADDADIPEVPEDWQEVLMLGAYYRILERNEDFDLAAFYKNGDYTEELDKMVVRLGGKQTGKPHQMLQPLRTGNVRSRGRV